MRRILCFGSLNIDTVFHVDHIVMPGETLSASSVEVFPGGKGMNQANALAKAGAEVSLAGMIGEDGTFLSDICRENGVDITYLRTDPAVRTGSALIQVTPAGENSILLNGGANRRIDSTFMDEVLGAFSADTILLLQNEVSGLDTLIDRAYDKGMRIVLNPSPMDETLLSCDLRKVSLFLLNEIEAAQMCGAGGGKSGPGNGGMNPCGRETNAGHCGAEPENLLHSLGEQYPDAEFVLTLGKHGAAYRSPDGKVHWQAAYPVSAVDTTAAGDTFTGYFLAGYAAGDPIEACLDLAARAASIAVTRPGAIPSIPGREEVRKKSGRIILLD